MNIYHLFARSDVMGTIYFTTRSCVASIREWRLLFIRRETATLGTAEQEESGPFTDIDNDKDEIEENEILIHVRHYSLLVPCFIIV